MTRIFIIVMICGISLLGCGKDAPGTKSAKKLERHLMEKASGAEDEELSYRQEVRNFKLEGFSKAGTSKWSVHGEFANIVEPDIFFKRLDGESLSDEMTIAITADSGIYNKNSRSAELKGNVVVTLSDGGKVYMDHARWNAGNEEIITDSPIKIEHSGIVLEGRGAIVKPQSEWAVIEHNIRMVDKSGRIINCEGPLEVDYKHNKAILKKNVEIIDEDGTIQADQVTAYFNVDTRQIERIEWLGNVKAVY